MRPPGGRRLHWSGTRRIGVKTAAAAGTPRKWRQQRAALQWQQTGRCTPSVNSICLRGCSGHHFLAQRVPDDIYFVSANQGRFQVGGASAHSLHAEPGSATSSACTSPAPLALALGIRFYNISCLSFHLDSGGQPGRRRQCGRLPGAAQVCKGPQAVGPQPGALQLLPGLSYRHARRPPVRSAARCRVHAAMCTRLHNCIPAGVLVRQTGTLPTHGPAAACSTPTELASHQFPPCRSSYPRLCALQSFFGGQSNASCWASLPLSPVFLKASRKLSLWDMFAALRHHNEGTPQDP